MTARSLCLAAVVLVSCAPHRPEATTVTSAPVQAPPPSITALAEGAVLFDGLGDLHKPVAASPEAQRFFDQGLRLTYGFNHDEAARSFARGAELDPSCAMCFWGVALVLGPNYNVPMLPDRARAAWDAITRARALAARSQVEQALVAALATRYHGPEPLDPPAMRPFEIAYASSMRDVAKRFPDDLDVQVLFAEALMDLNPWKLWSNDGKPAPGTEEIVATLERVLARAPTHPGANHYYIHAVEASPHPERALASADRLGGLMPAAGHTVHMPAHIYQRVGRYADASLANERAIAADLAYMSRVRPPGYYAMYLGHNYGFLSYSASMEGRRAASLAAARESAKALPPEMMNMMPGMDFFVAEPLLAMVRFGAWDELLAEPRPDPKYMVLTALWLHGHGMALASTGRLADARRDLAELTSLRNASPADLPADQNTAKDIFAVAAKVLEARIASVEKDPNALALWQEAVDMSDRLAYAEPADWFYPVRHYQGAALLSAGKAKEAEAVYREDLRRNPNNGWALFGLWKALEQDRRPSEASVAKAAFDRAWARADFRLTTSAP